MRNTRRQYHAIDIRDTNDRKQPCGLKRKSRPLFTWKDDSGQRGVMLSISFDGCHFDTDSVNCYYMDCLELERKLQSSQKENIATSRAHGGMGHAAAFRCWSNHAMANK